MTDNSKNFKDSRLENISNYIRNYVYEGKKLFVTSSFQTHSIPLLHIISRIDNSIPVMFLNTGFLFPETIEFKNKIADSLGLDVIDVKPSVPKSQQRNSKGNFYFTSNTNRCCHFNKVQPMDSIMIEYDVWINGVRGDQNANRAAMNIEQSAPFDCLRFHPMLDWSSKMIYEYRIKHDLPPHPLEALGYFSIGCQPCTRKWDINDERGARWYGQNKTECGLHTNLIVT